VGPEVLEEQSPVLRYQHQIAGRNYVLSFQAEKFSKNSKEIDQTDYLVS
jgi:hypothetical protein